MKKNLMSIIILALLVVNIVLTTITMISVTSTNKATAALVSDIAAAINLELGSPEEEENVQVSMADTVTFDFPESLTIPLKKGEDGKEHYALVTVSLAMNAKDEGYETYGATIDTKVSLITGEITDVYTQYTKEEAIEEGLLNIVGTEMDDKYINTLKNLFFFNDLNNALNGHNNNCNNQYKIINGISNINVIIFQAVNLPSPDLVQ